MGRPLDCVVASALRVLDSDSDAMECLEAGTGTGVRNSAGNSGVACMI